MLVHLLGFAHPQDLMHDDVLPDMFRRVWYFVASICFRSADAFANYLHHPSAMEALSKEPHISLTAKQRGMIGEARVRAAVQAQVEARGGSSLPDVQDRKKQMTFFASTLHADSSVDAGAWATLR